MFNEILTGKATLEEKPKQDPYREPSVPDVTIHCDQCRKPFSKKATSTATTCMDCVLQNAANAGAHHTYANQNVMQGDDVSWRVIKVFIYIGVAILLAVIKWNIRHG